MESFPLVSRPKPPCFETSLRGHALGVQVDSLQDRTTELPALVFVRRQTCGVSRRMESLVAWVTVTQKKRIRVVDIDADRNPAVAQGLGVRRVPTLVLIKDRRVVARFEGRATGRQIQDLIRPYVSGAISNA
ncbi:MAG: thioredoxin family protein [Gaiellaceae bacterium]